MKYFDKILYSGKTIFSYDDIKILLGIENENTIKSLLYRLVKGNILVKIYKGIFGLKNFDIFELALKLKKNSYVSFETVLKQNAIIFQHYGETIFLASDNTIEKQVGGKIFNYRKLKNSILHNPIGIINEGNYMIASSERAICDVLYLNKFYGFDNLEYIDKEKLIEIAKIYNKRVENDVRRLVQKI